MNPTDPHPKVEQSGSLVILTFTAYTARDVECVVTRELGALASGIGDRHLLLDFTHIKRLSGKGLGTLVSLHSRAEMAGGRLTLFNLSADVFLLFTLTRLDTLLDICRPGTPELTGQSIK